MQLDSVVLAMLHAHALSLASHMHGEAPISESSISQKVPRSYHAGSVSEVNVTCTMNFNSSCTKH